MKDKTYPPLVLLVVAAFWAPIAGGYISTDTLSLLPGQNGFFTALLGDAAVPLLSHALIALPVLAALGWVLAERQVQQVANQKLTVCLMLLMGLIVVSVGFSAFKAASIAAALEWLIYGAALMACVAIVGRRKGPLALLSALFAGCVVVALKGLIEYGEQSDKTWRIFGGWIGPNALAAMLLVGLFVGLGIMLSQNGTKALLAGIGVSLIGFALILTQSKGGLLAFGVALLAFMAVAVLWTPERAKVGVARTAAACAVIVVLAFGLQAAQKAAATPTPGAATASGPATPLARFTNTAGNQEQSFDFRRNLWKGALEIAKETPTGVGIGAYRFSSAKPGLTTQTQLAHESFLQLLAEAGIVAPILFVALLAIWSYFIFRAARGVPPELRMLRAGVFAAVVAIVVHSLIDSDLYYFGVGISFFMLLGVGLLLTTDSVAPEFLPKGLRSFAIAGSAVVGVLALAMGWAESVRSAFRGAIMTRDVAQARSLSGSLQSAMSWDGETWYLSSQLASSPQERLDLLRQAVVLAPSTRNLRALARAQAEAQAPRDAVATLLRALEVDPNNLLTLSQLLARFVEQGDSTSARNTARRILSVENTAYFRTRSQPEIVPLETAETRLFLARDASKNEKIDLLEGAVKLYADYAARTVPQVLQMAQVDPNADYGGESVPGAIRHMNDAKTAVDQLSEAYRAAGRTEKAVEVEGALQGFDAALGKLEGVGRK